MKTYTKREIAYQLQVSPRTVLEDIKHLNLTAKEIEEDRGTKLYDEHDFELIKQLREHCKDKTKSRDSFAPQVKAEIVETEPKISKLAVKKEQDNFIENFQNSIRTGLTVDPFFDLELLQRISDNRWLVPTKRLAPLLNVNPVTLRKYPQYSYCGFTATKDCYVGNKVLWRITYNKT